MTNARDDRFDSRSGLTATTLLRSFEAAGSPAASSFQGRSAAFAHLEDRCVEDDVRVLHRQLPLLHERVDLVVLAEEHGLHALLPGDPDLFPKRVVVGLAWLRAEDREL